MKTLNSIPWMPFGRLESKKQTAYHLKLQKERVSLINDPIFISLIVPPSNSNQALEETLSVLKHQSYPHFEILIGNPKETIQKAKGNWVGILEAGDFLSPYTFFYLALEANQNSPDFIYTHQVQLQNRKIHRLVHKPQWSEIALEHCNYLDRFWIVRKELFKIENNEWNFLLSLRDKKLKKTLLPLFCWYGEVKKFQVKSPSQTTSFSLSEKKVSVITCFRNKWETTTKAMECLSQQRSEFSFEVFLVNNQSDPKELEHLRSKVSSLNLKVHWMDYDKPYNFSEMQNEIILKEASGDFIFLLNNDVFLSEPRTLQEMIAWANRSEVGTVGLRLHFPDGNLQHAGLKASPGRLGKRIDFGNQTEPSEFTEIPHEVLGNSFAACAFRKELFTKIGGLDSLKYPIGFSDLAFSFECQRLGLKNVYLGHLKAVHAEGTSRGHRYEYPENKLVEAEYGPLALPWVDQDLKIRKKKYNLAENLVRFFPYLNDRRFKL